MRPLLGEDSKAIDARPIIFSNDQFLRGARYLYNLGRYDAVRKCFEDGLHRLSGRWSDMPAVPYFYHYLKTLHALGRHREAIEITEQYKDADFPAEIRAAMAVSNGLGFWKVGDFALAIDSLRTAIDLYRSLSRHDIKHKINEADAWVLYSIAYLEMIRSLKDIYNSTLISGIERGIRNAETLFAEYEESQPEVTESHYKGRYWGLKAFVCLLQIDTQNDRKTSDAWDEALKLANDAHGGEELAHRNPFGAMCGRYCAAVVNYHKYESCENELDRRQAVLRSRKIINDVQHTYDDLFGPTKRIFRLWPKIHRLAVLVQGELPDEPKQILSSHCGSDETVEEIEIYTPLH
jgi:tetratricopeptide (TPR) repeat protein